MEKGMATHSSVLAWEIPWTEEPGGLQSVASESDTTERLSAWWSKCSPRHFVPKQRGKGLREVRGDWAALSSRSSPPSVFLPCADASLRVPVPFCPEPLEPPAGACSGQSVLHAELVPVLWRALCGPRHRFVPFHHLRSPPVR